MVSAWRRTTANDMPLSCLEDTTCTFASANRVSHFLPNILKNRTFVAVVHWHYGSMRASSAFGGKKMAPT